LQLLHYYVALLQTYCATLYSFATFPLNPDRDSLMKNGDSVSVTRWQHFDILIYNLLLIYESGFVVTIGTHRAYDRDSSKK